MLNANPLNSQNKLMNGILHLILATPGSSAFAFLSSAFEPVPHSNAFILYPKKETPKEVFPSTTWNWDSKDFKFQTHNEDKIEEWILFLSNDIEVADQVEAVLRMLSLHPELSMGRILVFLNAQTLAEEENLYSWLDGCAHFADAICFSNRENSNGKHVQDCIKRYSSMRYPLETYLLSKKNFPVSSIFNPIARRISHVFDSPELLEQDEIPESDPYLERKANGQRVRNIPLIFSSNM